MVHGELLVHPNLGWTSEVLSHVTLSVQKMNGTYTSATLDI